MSKAFDTIDHILLNFYDVANVNLKLIEGYLDKSTQYALIIMDIHFSQVLLKYKVQNTTEPYILIAFAKKQK